MIFMEPVYFPQISISIFISLVSTHFCELIWIGFWSRLLTTICIMHQYSTTRNIIRVIILNLKVIDRYRCFKNLMLNLFDDHIFAIKKLKPIPGTEVYCVSPTLLWYPKWVCWCRGDLFAVYSNMYKFATLTDKTIYNFFEFCLTGRIVRCSNKLARLDFSNFPC